MKRVILAPGLIALTLQAQAETPRQFAKRFYQATFQWKIRGVPNRVELNRIAPFFSTEILSFSEQRTNRQTESSLNARLA